MVRPSRDLDRKLLDAARAMLPEAGLSGLSVREVCRRAQVAPGMFHYHFRSKEDFLRRVLQECYENFFATFREAAEAPGAPIVRLRRVLVAFGRFARDNRPFYAVLARELLNDNAQCLAFLRENFPRHASIVAQLMEECVRSRAVRARPLPFLVSFAMMGMGMPNIVAAALERHAPARVHGSPLSLWREMMLSDRTIEERADMIIAGLAPRRKR